MRAVVVRLWYCIPVHVRHGPAQIYWGCTNEITNPFCFSLFSESFSAAYVKDLMVEIALG